MIINSKFAYVKKKETFEPLITTIPKGLNPIVFIEDTREMWTCGTYFSIGYPSIEVSESSGSVKVNIGNSFFLLSTAGESISVRKGDGNRIIISSNALNRVDTEAPLTWNTTNRKLLHMDSGVAPGSYGQSTNLGNASVFVVPNIMVDSTGHITHAQNYNVEIRDYVEQLAPSTLAGNRNVLLSYNADSESMDTSQVRKANGLLFNDSTQRLTVEGGLDTNGAVFVNHGDLSVLDGYIIGHLKGDVEGEAKPKIHLSNKPEYGGASINLYGHVKLQDVLNNKPEPSSDNENINDTNIANAIAASPLMVWNAIQTAKDYADSILGSNNAMLYKGSLEAGVTYPGTYTPTGQIGNTYVVTFGSGNYIDSIGYINGEPVEVGDLVICKEDTPAATSTTWEEVKPKWTYIQTNNTGVVSGPSSSTIGQLAVFNNTKGKLIKGLPNGNVGQILSIDESGIPAWVNKPDRLNYALSFQADGAEFISFDGYEPKKVNFIAGDNMFITSDTQGNLTFAADPGSDTVNTAGATNNPNTKLFLIGAESQTTAPQTYSNQYVYIGPDNKLYSNGKEVSTTDHNHDDRYVNVTGDTMTGVLSITCSDTYPLVLNSSSEHLAIIIKNANTNKSRFGWNQEYGSYIYDYTADKYINIKSDSLYWNNSNPFLHTGNYATTLDTRYVKKSGDSMSGVLSITTSDIHPLVITSSNEQETSIDIASKGTIGYHSSKGIFLNNKTTNKILEINDGILFDGNKVWHAGNDGSGSGLDADTVDGYQAGASGQNPYGRIPVVGSDGVMEVGRYLDFHHTSNTSDYNIRLQTNTANTGIVLNLPTASGTLARTADNVASATKLQTARTLWGKSFDGTANVDGCIRIQANEGSYCEGIRIKPYNNGWATILLGGNDLTSNTGTSANSWSIHNNNGKFYINKNSSNGSTGSELCNVNGNWGIGTVSPSYKLHVGGNAYVASGLTSSGDIILNQNGSTGTRQLRIQCGDNDYGRIAAGATAANAGWMEIATADDGNEPIYVRQYTGVYSTVKRTLTLLDSDGNSNFPGNVTTKDIYGSAGSFSSVTSSGDINTNARFQSNGSNSRGLYPNIRFHIPGINWAQILMNGSGQIEFRGGAAQDSSYITAIAGAFVKGGSSDSYVLLGGGGHTTLSGLYTSHNHFERTDIDPNNIVSGPRTYETTNAANRPDTNTWHQYTTLGTGDNGYCHQLSYAYAGGTNIYHRVKNNGSWGGWITILDTYNYAEVLDGRYVNVTGDTMTGKLTIQSSSLNGTYNGLLVGDDCNIGDCNIGNTIGLMGTTNNNAGMIKFGKGGYQFGYNGSSHYVSGTGIWTNFNADLLDGLHASSFVRVYTGRFTQYNSGTWTKILQFTIPNGSLEPSIAFTWHPTECARDIWADFSINIRSGSPIFYANWKGGNRRNMYCVGDGTTYSVWVQGTKSSWDPYGLIQVTSTWSINSYSAGSLQYSDSEPSGTYKVGASTSGFALYADRLLNSRTINGTGFNGTANITTSYWGTARTLTVGNSAKSVNGSANISWSLSEIGAAAASHTHGLLHDNFGVILANTTSDSGWSMINGSYNGFILKSIRMQGSAPSWALGNYSAGICFGGGDTKGVISMSYDSPNVRFAGGNGSKPVWYFSLSGVNGVSYNLDNLISKYLSEVTYITNLDSPSWFNGGNNYGISLNSYNGSASNQPGGGDNANSVLNICNTKHGTSGVYGWQIAFENHEIFARKWQAGSKTGWYKIWHSGNFNPDSMISNNILWASYLVNTGGSGSYSKLSGNYNFISGRTREGTGRLLLAIVCPSGYSITQIMMSATGHHVGSNWASCGYASIQPNYGTGSSIRVMTANDSTHDDGECIVNFILIKTS